MTDIHKVGYPVESALDRAIETCTHSWEQGALAEALLEYRNPELSVFSSNPFLRHDQRSIPLADPVKTPSLAYAAKHITLSGPTLYPDDNIGVADPCSLGVSALLLGQSNPAYLDAARRQLEHVLYHVPRLDNGAISHRTDVSEAWSDFVYMLPPFLAYSAVAFQDESLLAEAFKQCKLYRDILVDDHPGSTTRGLWRHISGPVHEDKGFWSTGCAWAAAGMVRILPIVLRWPDIAGHIEKHEHGTMAESKLDLTQATTKLTNWIVEIIQGAMRVDDETETGLLRNYLGDNSYFPDAAGTALLASVVYRMASLGISADFDSDSESGYVQWADAKRKAVARHVDDATGIASPVCQSTDHRRKRPLRKSEINPEAQCFLVMLGSAWRDWAWTQVMSGLPA